MPSHHALLLKPPSTITNASLSLYPNIPQNPIPFHLIFSPSKNTRFNFSVLNCKGIEVPVAKHSLSCFGAGNTSVHGDDKLRVKKDFDVATLGNLCVDIVLGVPKLPPKPLAERKAYMDELSKSRPDKKYWEAGGNCNMAIAASRLGLKCATIGHIGSEIYGKFLLDVLHNEGINMVEINIHNNQNNTLTTSIETLVCWVLVDPLHTHGFCSRADFFEDPAFNWLTSLSTESKMAIKQSKVLFCNGYGFDELPPNLLVSALEYAIEVGTSIFFDPGPRGKSLASGTTAEQGALDKFLRMSDVLLLTSEEAESLTGLGNPILAGQELIRKGVRTKWVIIKMGQKGSILLTKSSISCAPAFKVNVIDTVGCGDSFVAAIAFGYIRKLPLSYILTLANAVGAATATGCGAGRNVATLEKVLELLKGLNLNEDDEKFWNELLEQYLETFDITMLCKNVVKGSDNEVVKRVLLQQVVNEVLPKLELLAAEKVLPS